MTSSEFVKGALRTEAPVTEELIQRFLNPSVFYGLTTAMADAINTGERIDRFKKHLFYNKPMPESNTATQIAPSVEERLRAVDMIRLIHSAIGKVTEAAELLDAVRQHLITGAPLNWVNLIEEKGDEFWYDAIFMDVARTTFEDVQSLNNRKLRSRYPDKFTEDKAVNRNLASELAVLANGKWLTAKTSMGLAYITQSDLAAGLIWGHMKSWGPRPSLSWSMRDGTHQGPDPDARYNLQFDTLAIAEV